MGGIPASNGATRRSVEPRVAVLDVVGGYDFPMFAGLDFGHRTANIPLPIGVCAAMDAEHGSLSLLEAAFV